MTLVERLALSAVQFPYLQIEQVLVCMLCVCTGGSGATGEGALLILA